MKPLGHAEANVELLALQLERDLALLASWLKRPHVQRWWGEPEAILAELRQRKADRGAIIAVDGKPVGYLCWQRPSPSELQDAGLHDLPGDLIDVDIMIGEPEALGRGIGPEALRQLLGRLRAQGMSTVGIGGAVANGRAMGAYAKVGFRPFRDFREHGQQYRYFRKNLDDIARGGSSTGA